MAETLAVEVRGTRGKRNARRMRQTGSVPAILYGHGQEVVSLTVLARELNAAIRRGSRMVSLTGGISESAFIRELQWDTWGQNVLHVDFTRVSEHEKVEVQLSIELRGEAPGIRDGGVVEHLMHELTIECEAGSIPEKISVNINALQLDGSIKLSELELSGSAKAIGNADAVVVQCVTPVVIDEEEELAGGAEPEVIGRKAEDEEEDNKS